MKYLIVAVLTLLFVGCNPSGDNSNNTNSGDPKTSSTVIFDPGPRVTNMTMMKIDFEGHTFIIATNNTGVAMVEVH